MEYLNLYKVYFKDKGSYSDFMQYEELVEMCKYLKHAGRLDFIEIYSIDMPKVTDKLQIIQTLKNQ